MWANRHSRLRTHDQLAHDHGIRMLPSARAGEAKSGVRGQPVRITDFNIGGSHHATHCERIPAGLALSDGWALLVSAGPSPTMSFELEGERTAARRSSPYLRTRARGALRRRDRQTPCRHNLPSESGGAGLAKLAQSDKAAWSAWLNQCLTRLCRQCKSCPNLTNRDARTR